MQDWTGASVCMWLCKKSHTLWEHDVCRLLMAMASVHLPFSPGWVIVVFQRACVGFNAFCNPTWPPSSLPPLVSSLLAAIRETRSVPLPAYCMRMEFISFANHLQLWTCFFHPHTKFSLWIRREFVFVSRSHVELILCCSPFVEHTRLSLIIRLSRYHCQNHYVIGVTHSLHSTFHRSTKMACKNHLHSDKKGLEFECLFTWRIPSKTP